MLGPKVVVMTSLGGVREMAAGRELVASRGRWHAAGKRGSRD